MQGFDILQITKPTEYFRRLDIIRSKKPDVKKAIEGIKDPFEIHHQQLGTLPSFQQAQTSALEGKVYCFWCASHHVIKGGHKEKHSGKYSFSCKDCKSTFSYSMDKQTYNAFDGLKLMKKGKYKARKK